MRIARMIVGGVMVFFGAVWIGQGLGYVGGSFMTGQMKWAYIGTAVLIGGGLLLYSTRRTA
ncbi:MAG TPA: hypothetical protein VMR50_19230 [Myxococcota bacterium]|nr:hypothetical protein [Myxococcota bacterium]